LRDREVLKEGLAWDVLLQLVEQQTNVVVVAERMDERMDVPRCTRGQLNQLVKQIGKEAGFEFNPAKFTDSMLWAKVQQDGKRGSTFREQAAGGIPLPWSQPSSAVDFVYANDKGEKPDSPFS
jgi:hypothetical protein